MTKRKTTSLEQLLTGIVVVIVLFWIFILKPLVEWIKLHWILSIILGIIILAIIIILLYFYFANSDYIPAKSEIPSIKEKNVSQEINLENKRAEEEWKGLKKEEEQYPKAQPSKPKDTKFNKIFNQIKNYSPPPCRDEKEFENMIYTFLTTKFPSYRIVQQFKTEKGRIDLVIDDKIAIELKLADSRANMQHLFGQVKDYKKVFSKVGIVILDIGVLSDLHEYVHDLKKEGIRVITVKGSLKRKKLPYMQQKFYR